MVAEQVFEENSLRLFPLYMAVATYCCYEKVRRTMRTAIALYLLKKVKIKTC